MKVIDTGGGAPVRTQAPKEAAAPKQAAKAASVSSAAIPANKLWQPPVTGEWALGASGGRSDPVNLYVHGSLAQVEAAFQKAGWTEANPNNTHNDLKYGATAVGEEIGHGLVGLWNKVTGRNDHFHHDPLHHQVNAMPVGTLYYDGKPQVAAFEKDNNPLGGRHHFRIFDTGKVDSRGQPVWAIAASRDIGMRFEKSRGIKTLFTNHVTQTNSDLERDTVLRDLRSARAVGQTRTLDLGFSEVSASHLHSEDGKVFDVILK